MRYFEYLLLVLCSSCILYSPKSISQDNSRQKTKYLFRTNLDTSKNNFGRHIEIVQLLPSGTNELISMSLDDRDIISRSKYPKQARIEILREFLNFCGDTNTSNKQYRFKAASKLNRPKEIKNFTVQIEALYSFTRILLIGIPPIKPILINRTSGEELNANQKAVNEVYKIYWKWYYENKKKGFRSFKLPLAGTPYCWLGEEKGEQLLLKEDL